MSLGGIAIAIGVLVDAGIVMTKNCRQAENYAQDMENIDPGSGDHSERRPCRRPADILSMAIIILAFVLCCLTGMEGKPFTHWLLPKRS